MGSFGRLAVLSFNGNKIITTGGGGAILTDDAELARRTRHVATTAKRAHRWEFDHDEVGYNYRMPNINAALGCAQLEQLDGFLVAKRRLAAALHRRVRGRAGRDRVSRADACALELLAQCAAARRAVDWRRATTCSRPPTMPA